MLGEFLLPAFIRLGHERQDLLSLCNGMQNGKKGKKKENKQIMFSFRGLQQKCSADGEYMG